MICYHCGKHDNDETDHDHFLKCLASQIRKEHRIKEIEITLVALKTSKELII